MRFLLLVAASLLFLSTQAQTTLSLTSRVDAASVFGFEDLPSQPFVFVDDDEGLSVGMRASFGLQVTIQTAKNQAMISGVEYSNSGYNFYKEFLRYDNMGSQNDRSYYEGSRQYQFISLPFGYQFHKEIGDWRIFSQISIIPMAYLRTVSYDKLKVGSPDRYQETVKEKDESIQDFHMASGVAMGVEYQLLKSWKIGLQPTFRMHLTSVKTTEFKERPWTAGLQLNIGKQLNGK